MASVKTKDTAGEAPVVEPKAVPAAKESVYTAEELVANHKAFQTTKEIVAVALRLAGKKTATFTEAKQLIDDFKGKEAK